MTDADRLKQVVNDAIPTSDLEWPGDDQVVACICRAIVEEFGIKDTDTCVRVSQASLVHHGIPQPCLEKVEAFLRAILDVAEADDE